MGAQFDQIYTFSEITLFETTLSHRAQHIQMHLNKLECRGKVHLFQ